MRSRSEEMRIATMISRRSLRHRLALGDGENRLLLDLQFERIDLVVPGDHPVGELGVALGQGIDGLGQLVFRQAAHLGQHGLEAGQIVVIGS